MTEQKDQTEAAGVASALTDELAMPVCCGEAIHINVSEYCCPIEYGSIAFCEHCGKEVEGSGTRPTKEAAEKSAIEQWRTSVANY